MDQDADYFNDELIKCDGVFYTWGYSWENDVLQFKTLIELFFMLSPIERDQHEIDVIKTMDEIYKRLEKQIRHYVSVDILLASKHLSFFPRTNYKQCIQCHPAHRIPPILNKQNLRNRLRDIKDRHSSLKPFYFKDGKKPMTIRYCYGHLLFLFCYRMITYLLKQYSSTPEIALNHLSLFAAKLFNDLISDSIFEEIYDYYSKQFLFLNN